MPSRVNRADLRSVERAGLDSRRFFIRTGNEKVLSFAQVVTFPFLSSEMVFIVACGSDISWIFGSSLGVMGRLSYVFSIFCGVSFSTGFFSWGGVNAEGV